LCRTQWRQVTEEELRQILQGDDLRRKAWAVARILEAARMVAAELGLSVRELYDLFEQKGLPT